MDKYLWLQIGVLVFAIWGGFMTVRIVSSDEWKLDQAQYECRYNPVRVSAVARFGTVHPCSRFIDQFRWSETQGMGFFPDGGIACKFDQEVASRELDCDGAAVAVAHAEDNSWDELSGAEFADAVFGWEEFSLSQGVTSYDPPRKE